MAWAVAGGMTLLALMAESGSGAPGVLRGRVLDEATGEAVPARVYVSDAGGGFHLVRGPAGVGTVTYDKTDAGTGIRETYALAVTAGFEAELPAGRYTVRIERGKEYVPLTQTVEVAAGRVSEETFGIQRLFDAAKLGWYSADCHVHTPLNDLPLAQLADDVNVAFPITAWTTRSDQVPSGGDVPRRGEVVRIDDKYVYWNLNTEYEIFQVGDSRHTLGSVMILGHLRPFKLTAPPIKPVAQEARAQGAVLDWEKHTWPWSTMLVPVAGIDVIELSNNSMWRQRTISHYLWGREPMPWVGKPPLNAEQFVQYGFESYYAMLNCRLVMHPSAGSANGVHPVPLGTSRVYAKVEGAFSYERWFEAYRQGRSFATNGPLLLLTADGLGPGERKSMTPGESRRINVSVEVFSTGQVERVELVVNGNVAETLRDTQARSEGRHRWVFNTTMEIEGSSWLAARCFERAEKDNPRFAHTGVVFFDDPSKPLRPQQRQIQYLMDTTARQTELVRGVLSEPAVAEFEEALRVYRRIAEGR